MRRNASSKLAPVDRNPSYQGLAWSSSGGIAPHGPTTRATRTIPAGKKGFMMSAQAWITRLTAAAPVAKAQVWIEGFAGTEIVAAQLDDNAVAAKHDQAIGQCTFLAEGAVVNIRSTDGSTGGTIEYNASCTLMEFDA